MVWKTHKTDRQASNSLSGSRWCLWNSRNTAVTPIHKAVLRYNSYDCIGYYALHRGRMKRKCHWYFSEDSQFPPETHSYKCLPFGRAFDCCLCRQLTRFWNKANEIKANEELTCLWTFLGTVQKEQDRRCTGSLLPSLPFSPAFVCY